MNPGGEEQSIGGSGSCVITELQCPEPVYVQDRVVGVLHIAQKFARNRIERRDVTSTEVSNQQRVAELPEFTRGQRNAPWRIKPGSMLQAGEQTTGWAKDINKTPAGSSYIVVALRILLCEGHDNVLAERLNSEGRVPVWQTIIVECFFRHVNRLEPGVIDLDATRSKICHVKEMLAVGFAQRHALVNSAWRIVDFQHGVSRIHIRVPARNRSVFGHKDKQSR